MNTVNTSEKLSYLKETEEQLKNTLKAWNPAITDETTFRELAEDVERKRKLNDKFFHCAEGRSFVDYTKDENGVYSVTTRGITYKFNENGWNTLVAPESKTGDIATNRMGPIALKAVAHGTSTLAGKPVEDYPVLDLSRIQNPGSGERLEAVPADSFAPSFFALPTGGSPQGNFVGFRACSKSDVATRYPHLFAQGISFGTFIGWNSVNSFFTADISALGDRVVTVEPGFSGSSLHLSRLSMSAETMINIINNLSDINPNPYGYTLDFGATNLAKLTEEQLNIAYEKGWNIT